MDILKDGSVQKMNVSVFEHDFITNDFLSDIKGEQPVSSTMFDQIFLNHNRVPAKLVQQFADKPEEVEKLLTGATPIFSTHIEKPYWKTQGRPYDRINVDIYGAVCLAQDRHVIDCIMAHGTLITDASRYTLRQVCDGLKLKDVAWDLIPGNRIDRAMKNHGVYFHIDLNVLCKAMGIKPQKLNKKSIFQRLWRLSLMTLELIPTKGGQVIGKNSEVINIVDKEVITILDKSKPRNKQFDAETRTDVIVNISEYYTKSLSDDGSISRRRMKNSYVHLVGKNSVEDFYKYLDSHKREWIHGQPLRKLVRKYFDNKMSTFGMNIRYKTEQLALQIEGEQYKLREHFNIALRREVVAGKSDFVCVYMPAEK